jgi:hypothetical protein
MDGMQLRTEQFKGSCPAGGEHVWGTMEEAGTGRTGIACEHCGAAPERESQGRKGSYESSPGDPF